MKRLTTACSALAVWTLLCGSLWAAAHESESPADPVSEEPADANPTKLGTPAPRYPPVAERYGAGGDVKLELGLDATGMVVHVEVYESSGHASLDASAVAAAYFWTFKPAIQDGKPVTSRIRVPITFEPPRD